MADDVNPFLAREPGDNKGGMETIEDDQSSPANIVWQTRSAVPTEYENGLGDALEAMFADGVTELADVVARLNKDFPRSDGSEWTEENFQAEIKRLGA